MADKHDIIKPVEEPQNIRGLTPVKRREERRRKRNFHHDEDEVWQEAQEPTEENGNEDEDPADGNTVDYCA